MAAKPFFFATPFAVGGGGIAEVAGFGTCLGAVFVGFEGKPGRAVPLYGTLAAVFGAAGFAIAKLGALGFTFEELGVCFGGGGRLIPAFGSVLGVFARG